MNLRVTTLFFALLLSMLWIFGLMVAHKKAAGDVSFIMPSLQGKEADFTFEKVTVKRTIENETVDAEFVFEADKRWYHHEGSQKVRLLGVRIDNIIKQIKAAKAEEHADVYAEPAKYGLKTPPTVVTIHGKVRNEDRKWEIFVGNESAGNFYVKTSDRDDRIFAVAKRHVEPIFNWKNATHLRDKRLFDFVDIAVTHIAVRKADKELELKKAEGLRWNFVKPPNMGIAGFGPQEPEKKDPHKKEPIVPVESLNSVQGMLTKIKEIHVDDDDQFVPLGKPASTYGLEKGKEHMRIFVHYADDKEKKEYDEILLIGETVKADKETYYYARMDGDDGVMKIHERYLEPVLGALNDPGKIRSLDVAHFDKDKVDVVTLKHGKTEFSFFKLEEKDDFNPVTKKMQQHWHMLEGKEKKRASDLMIDALMNQVLGKKAIVEFPKGTDDELKKKEADWELTDPRVVVSIYENGIEPPKKDEKKEEKKKEDKDAKKEDKKEDKKDEKTEDPLPLLKDKHKAEVTLAIGKTDKDTVYIRRTLKDGTVTYFTMKKEFPEAILPREGVALGYLDASLPKLAVDDVTDMTLKRTTEKPSETLRMQRRHHEGKPLWFVVDEKGENPRLAASTRSEFVLKQFASLNVKKWVKLIGENDDLQKLDLKPTVIATITAKKEIAGEYSVKDKDGKAMKGRPAHGVVGVAAMAFHSPLAIAGYAVGAREVDPGETITIALGKETDDEKDKPGAFATHSGKPKLLFLTHPETGKMIVKEDLRDRSSVLYAQVGLEAAYRGATAITPMASLLAGPPYFPGNVHDFDYKKIARINMTVRSHEVRSFSFERADLPKPPPPKEEKKKDPPKDEKKVEAAKDKKGAGKEEKKLTPAEEDKLYSEQFTWKDKSGLQGFDLDPEKVVQLLKDTAKLQAQRFVSFKDAKKGEFKPPPDLKLEKEKATIVLEVIMENGPPLTVIVGTHYLNYGYFATTDAWPGTVFFVSSPAFVEAILRGPSHFSKERIDD